MRVDFYMGPEFLRTKQKTNPFFDPIIEVCEDHGIEWRVVFSSKPKECGYPKENVGSFAALIKAGIWFWKVVHLLMPRVPYWKAYLWYGWIAKWFVTQRRVDLRITISGWLDEIGTTLFPQKRIVDLQHGVIYSTHSGYFNADGRLRELLQQNTAREFWVYGRGYADCFFKHPDNKGDLKGRVKVIGDVIRANEKPAASIENSSTARDTVAVSLQFTHDCSDEENALALKRLEAFCEEFLAKYGGKYRLILKHHPRFYNCIDMSGLYERSPAVKEDKTPWAELYPRLALHVTFCSTVGFDCASAGVPTYLIGFEGSKKLANEFYRDDYEYPFYGKSIDEILEAGESARKTVLDWFHRFYTPFDKENCLKLIKGEI